jgi:predicted tellurium resistance membrane protein TerC
MVIAVVVAVFVMLMAATPLSNFIGANPTIVMLALAFLMGIGMALIAEGFGAHLPKGYIYAAMAFSALVEGLNMLDRRARQRLAAQKMRNEVPLEKSQARGHPSSSGPPLEPAHPDVAGGRGP